MKPVGPQPPNVYWRRRVLAVVVLVVVLGLLIWAVTALIGAFTGGDEPAKQPSPGASGTAAPSSSPSGSASEGGAACTARDVEVVATADSRTHKVGDTAQIGMTITNSSDKTCRMDVGSAAITILVKSGSDQVWSSDDCETGSQSNQVDIEAGQAMESVVPWKTERSAAGCETGLSAIRPGTYQVVAKAGEITSAPLTMTIQEAETTEAPAESSSTSASNTATATD